MTLLEMIKKYTKKDITKESIWASQVVEDLRSIEEHPSVTYICDEILKRIGMALKENDPDGALTWARVLQTLPG